MNIQIVMKIRQTVLEFYPSISQTKEGTQADANSLRLVRAIYFKRIMTIACDSNNSQKFMTELSCVYICEWVLVYVCVCAQVCVCVNPNI